jgi:NAD(P)-dependent dehydrogenase (short-subunit alcohol dehydrogenase family)
MEIKDKVILLTGASGGLGSHIAQHYAKQGYHLALHYFQEEIVVQESETVQHFQADLRNFQQIEAMVDAIMATFGKIDILINNAGVSRNDVVWKAKKEDWDETIAINLTSPFLLSKLCIPSMRQHNWGRIINVSSVVAQTGFVGTSAYTASKAGLIGLTKTWAKEVARYGITVNDIALGYFNTGMINEVPPNIQDEIKHTIPLHKLGEPQALLRALDYILDNEAAYFTGQTLNLNGGMY